MTRTPFWTVFLLCSVFGAASAFAQPPCTHNIPKSFGYRPSMKACNGKAAILLKGNLINSFSVVVRDHLGRDRIPDESCEVNSCSIAKTQKTIYTRGVRIACLGASGRVFKKYKIRRATIKLNDTPPKKILRYCIKDPTESVN
jgi:hypothetical protein